MRNLIVVVLLFLANLLFLLTADLALASRHSSAVDQIQVTQSASPDLTH